MSRDALVWGFGKGASCELLTVVCGLGIGEGKWGARLTAGPQFVHVGSAFFPAEEMALHVLVKVFLCRLNQVIVVGIIIPHAFVPRHCGFGATDDDTAVSARNQVIVHSRPGPETVRVVQVWRLFRVGSHDAAAYSAAGHNLLRVLGQNAGGETVGGKDDLLGCDCSSRRRDGVATIVVRGRRHMRDGRVRLQVEPLGNGEAEEMSDEFVRPEMRGGEAEATFRVLDTGYSFRVSCWGKMCVLNGRQAFVHHDVVRFFGFMSELFV